MLQRTGGSTMPSAGLYFFTPGRWAGRQAPPLVGEKRRAGPPGGKEEGGNPPLHDPHLACAPFSPRRNLAFNQLQRLPWALFRPLQRLQEL